MDNRASLTLIALALAAGDNITDTSGGARSDEAAQLQLLPNAGQPCVTKLSDPAQQVKDAKKAGCGAGFCKPAFAQGHCLWCAPPCRAGVTRGS